MTFLKKNGMVTLEIAALLLVITLVYLPGLRKATIFRDDWYYTMDRSLGGPSTFPEMFKIDRPARGPFFELYYQLFGIEPAPYHMAAFIFRLALGLSALWLFSLLWPRQRLAVFFITCLFVIYPGYTRWLEGFEDQPKIASMLLMVLSIAMTLKAIQAQGRIAKAMLWAGSIVTGWGYMLLVDYAAGMEVFRFLSVFVLVNRDRLQQAWVRRGLATLRAGAPALLIAGVYLTWRLFIFQNTRPETDISLHLNALTSSPLIKGSWWLLHFIQSVVNGAVLAWAAPFFQGLFGLRLRDVLAGSLLAVLTGGIVLLGGLLIQRQGEKQARSLADKNCAPWQVEATWMGLLGVMAGVIPIIIADRSVVFGAFSHYAMPASLAAATFIVGVSGFFASRRAQAAVISLLVILAATNHYIAAQNILKEEQVISDAWHQIAWRIPGLREGTTLAVNYGSISYGEDVDAVNGPANLLYFPQPYNQLPVKYKLYALKQSDWTSKDALTGGLSTAGYRTHYGNIDYENLLVISQASENACVHVIDRRYPWYSYNDQDSILLIGSLSKIDTVITNAAPPRLPAAIFGPEPAHGWCYYFEKAELALQLNDLQQIAALADEAARQKLHPQELLEWMPFLQAYAALGNEQGVRDTASKINENRYNRGQACSVLTSMQNQGTTFAPEIHALIQGLFCNR